MAGFITYEAPLFFILLYLCCIPYHSRSGLSGLLAFALAFHFASFSFAFAFPRLAQVVEFTGRVLFVKHPFCPFISCPLFHLLFSLFIKGADVHCLGSVIHFGRCINGTELHNVVSEYIKLLLGGIVLELEFPCVIIRYHLQHYTCLQTIVNWVI